MNAEERDALRAEVEDQHGADVDRMWAGLAEHMKPWWRKVLDRIF